MLFRSPVEGTVDAPVAALSSPSAADLSRTAADLSSRSAAEGSASLTASEVPQQSASSITANRPGTFSASVDASPQAILQREARASHSLSDENIFDNGDRTPPQSGIAPDLAARSGLSSGPRALDPGPSSVEDRGIYHASDAMKSMYDMGDSPSCATCGAIMTRSGSCYRCMSCGSTSGCS